VCPVFKSGSDNLFSNYRPISVLPSFSKIIEKAAYNRLENYINSHNILSSCQYGFRAKHSTFMALMNMYDKITKSIDCKEFSIGVFIDLSKAFDTINHKILFRKLEHYGVRGVTLQWFIDYLSNRKQLTLFNNVSSSYQDITCGVPQGSILGPLLFLLYVNDMVNCSKLLHFILFADDTNLFFSCKNINELIDTVNGELDKLAEWFRANKLSLNISKTNYILFGFKHGKQNMCRDILIDGKSIEQVTHTKFLGVYIDENLNWKYHTSQLSIKVSKNVGIINKIKHLLTKELLTSLYYTLIQPYLIYCNIIWGGASKLALYRLSCIQKRAVRLITRSPYRTPSSKLFYNLGILKLCDIHKFQQLMFMYKAIHKVLPNSCSQFITLSEKACWYNLRKDHQFAYSTFRTKLRENSIAIAGPRLWNSLPDHLQLPSSISIFKCKLVKMLLLEYTD
jgi:hypothetical protein